MKQVKDIIINNQVHNLSQLYIMLVSTLNPTIVQNREGPCDVIKCQLPEAARSAAEVALIDVCNRLSEIVRDPSRWTLDKRDEREYDMAMATHAKQIEQEMIMSLLKSGLLEEVDENKSNKKKGKSDEQK